MNVQIYAYLHSNEGHLYIYPKYSKQVSGSMEAMNKNKRDMQ